MQDLDQPSQPLSLPALPYISAAQMAARKPKHIQHFFFTSWILARLKTSAALKQAISCARWALHLVVCQKSGIVPGPGVSAAALRPDMQVHDAYVLWHVWVVQERLDIQFLGAWGLARVCRLLSWISLQVSCCTRQTHIVKQQSANLDVHTLLGCSVATRSCYGEQFD